MNVERLHLIVDAALKAVERAAILADLQRLSGFLLNQVNDPATPSYQQQVSTVLERLRESLEKVETNDFPPAWKQALEELHLSHFIGSKLLEVIDEIFSRNAITPSIALKEIQEEQNEFEADVSAATEIIKGLGRLEIAKDDLKPGEAEIGLLVPRESIDSKLDRFAKELADTAKIVRVFEELTTGQRRDPTIKTISSSDLTVLLDIWPVSGVALATAIERIAAFYKQTLEIKKLKGEIKKLSLPQKMGEQLDAQANEKMESNLRDLRDELIQKYEGDAARKNELENELLISLHRIANKLDQGIHYEFRAAEPTAAADEEPDEHTLLRTHVRTINEIGSRLVFLPTVEGRILQLNTDDGELSNGSDASVPARGEETKKKK
ncbi:hypothetical protein AB8A31_08005 [Tardiphaga sp. 804_B3_N1_9]|uniref:hypothetical protein n=1 Tax=Tardiphaga TaxID=1395974 RepID=UPI001586187D|nr:hypothetical protein [Tardiphaga robiniae]NUU43745.1 hypothetical protein [Tardiphaga robiniae]